MENELLKTIEEKLSKNKDEIMAILNQNIKNEEMETDKNFILTNFWDFFNNQKNKYTIVIPTIQRNYVQGNDKNIREKIITDIFDVLKNDEDKYVNLDIIYGIKYRNQFVPIDGQQRLTTLFLLYWYVFWKNNRFDLLKKIHFTYENRQSSKEFFELLNNLDETKRIFEQEEGKISDKIKNSTGFYSSKWNKDLTIQSALKMLDEIENKFKDCSDTTVSKLINQDKPKIIFRCKFLDAKENTDAELYIKMNSRGKKLSEYEILKSNLESIAFKCIKDNDTYMSLCSNLDNTWANVFLQKIIDNNAEYSILNDAKEEEKMMYSTLQKVENTYFNFLKKFVIFYFLDNALETKGEELKQFKDELQNDVSIRFNEEGIYSIREDFFDKLENLMRNIKFLFSNHTTEECNNIKEIMDLEDLWKKNIESNKRYLREELYFYAIIKYLESATLTENLNINYEHFENWIRITRNYINSNYHIQIADRSKTKSDSIYFKIAKNIKKMITELENTNHHNVLRYVSEELNKETFENALQNETIWMKNEKLKAQYILKTDKPEWKDAIIEADKDQYFRGVNYFLFKLIENEENAENKLEIFKKYQKVIGDIFKDKQNQQDENDDDKKEDNSNKQIEDFLIQRAMLTKEDYFTVKNNIKIFYVFNYPDNTNTWLYILNEEDSNILSKLKNFIDNDILENMDYKQINVTDRLKQIINNSHIKQNDWRYYFIRDKRLFNTCKQGNIEHLLNEEVEAPLNANRILNLINTQKNSKQWDYLTKLLEYVLTDCFNQSSKANSEDLKITVQYNGATGTSVREINGTTGISVRETKYNDYLKLIFTRKETIKNQKSIVKEYTFVREENGKYKIHLKDNGETYFSFNYNITLDGRDMNDKEREEFLNNFTNIDDIEII